MARPTIALCMIAKNEAHNVGPLLQSVRGCFDEIHITDTGSTDGTVEFIEKVNRLIDDGDTNWSGIPKIEIHHFDWINDFAAARNYSFSFARTDFLAWLDLDDRLSSASEFIKWRDGVMHSAHYWMATYNYAFDDKGKVQCQFIRERVVKRDHGFRWKYFVHEGLVQEEGRKFWPQRVTSWWVNHARTDEDKRQDHMRNIKLFESQDVATMAARMKFYYGKELFENGFQDKAAKPLMEALKDKDLDLHDRLLAIQYAAQSAVHSKAYPQAQDLLMNGLRLMISRAEYWCLLGDIYLAQNQMSDAIHAWKSALNCQVNDLGGAIVVHDHAYSEYPHQRLAQVLMNVGRMDEAKEHIEALRAMGSKVVEDLERQFNHLEDLGYVREGLPKTEDVVITCPPQGAVTDWDEHTLESKGHGGSETAAIEVAKWIKKKTNRKVKIFHPRAKREVMPSGVEYLPPGELAGYMHNVEPKAHIAWRHAVRLTKAKSYIWCHDLQCHGADKAQNYDKIVALSEFHKRYLIETNGVPEEKIVLGFNGVNPDDFPVGVEKNPLKVVFSSSPDRGLYQSIDIVKRAREISGLDIKLHCFYGTANMRKAGQIAWAEEIEKHIEDHSDFVVYHGMVRKKELMRHFAESAVWLYPADFIETFCITALEAMYSGCWSIVRDMGALKYTMSEAMKRDMCDVLDVEVKDEASTGLWANCLVEALIDKKWKKVDLPMEMTWEKVADFFIKEFEL